KSSDRCSVDSKSVPGLVQFKVFSVSSVVNSRLRYRQLTFPQILDPIAQLRRFFKLKSLCVLAHFKLKAFDCLRDLLSAVTIDLFQLQRHFEIIGFGRGYQSRFDRFDDRHRSDAMLTVVDLLQGAPATR